MYREQKEPTDPGDTGGGGLPVITGETFYGGSGNDEFNGTDVGDKFVGRAGSDTILGYGGGDYFIPGPGDDFMELGNDSAADRIDFVLGDGHDKVYDFRSQDYFQIQGFAPAGTSRYANYLDLRNHMIADGSNTIIQFASSSITIVGVTPDQLTYNNFYFAPAPY